MTNTNAQVQNLRNLIEGTNGKFFTTTFTKKDGTLRTMNCRLGVKKHLVHGGPSSTAHIPKYITVFEPKNDGSGSYKNINLETIRELSVGGVKVFVS